MKKSNITASRGGLHVGPPPKSKGENLFRVVYVIDVDAPSAKNAAVQVEDIMTSPKSFRPILHTINGRGVVKVIALDK